MSESPTTVCGTGREPSRAYKDAYLALTSAAWKVTDAREKYGAESPEHREASERRDAAHVVMCAVVEAEAAPAVQGVLV